MRALAVGAIGFASITAFQGCPPPNSWCNGHGDKPKSCATVLLNGEIHAAASPGRVFMNRPNQPDPSAAERQACRDTIVLAMSTAALDATGVSACNTFVHLTYFDRDT